MSLHVQHRLKFSPHAASDQSMISLVVFSRRARCPHEAHGVADEFPKTLGSPHPFSIEHHHDHEHQPDHPLYELDPTNLERQGSDQTEGEIVVLISVCFFSAWLLSRMFEGVEDTAVHAYCRRHSLQARGGPACADTWQGV